MSGPKSSRYTLTPEQRTILAEQRKIERRRAKALTSIKNNSKRLLQLKSNLSNKEKIAIELKNISNNDGDFENKMKEFESLEMSINHLIKNENKDDVNTLENISNLVSDGVKKAEKVAEELSNIAIQNEIKLQNYLNNAIFQGTKTSFNEMGNISQNTLNKVKENIMIKLKEIEVFEYLSNDLRLDISNAIEHIKEINQEEYLKNFNALTVMPLIRNCNKYKVEYENNYEEYTKLINEYTSLCNLHYYVAQEYPCCLESIEKLKSEIERIKNEVAEDDEQAYISECLDEVMEEMGYNVIGKREVVKKSGRRFKNELYTYGEGTAVNVTYSSDGRISMELGGIDSVDRIPSNREAEMLCASMEQFCDDFKEIEKRLLAKGVILAERISHLPSSAEYAQIINVEDYEIENNIDKLQVKKQNRNIKNTKAMMKE